MSVSVQLDTPRLKVWTPGDKVSGRVVLNITDDTEVNSVNIKFRGKARAKIVTHNGQNRQTHTHQEYLFVIQKVLFQGPFKLPARDEHSWPFEFTFPSRTNADCTGQFSSGDTRRFQEGPQMLPPTASEYSSSGGHECTVNYKVKAEIPRTFHNWSSEVFLNFTPLRLEEEPELFPITRSDVMMDKKYRLDNNVPRDLSTRESMLAMFQGPGRYERLSFKVQMEAPTALVIGKPIPLNLTIALETRFTVADKAHLPPFILQEVNGALKANTSVRVPGMFSDYHRDFNNDISLGGRRNLATPVPLDVPMSLTQLWPSTLRAAGVMSAGVGPWIAPTFSTYSSMVNYGLKFHVIFTVLDKTYEAKVKYPNVVVHSAYLESPMQAMSEPALPAMEKAYALPPPEVGQVPEDLPQYSDPGVGSSTAQPPSYGDQKHKA